MAKIALYIYTPMVGSSHAQFFAIEHNVPCIVTDCETFKEVLGENGALYIQPNDVDMLAESMKKILEKQDIEYNIKNRLKIIKEEFTWEKTAKEHLNTYKNALKN